jgi:hypothetical protein
MLPIALVWIGLAMPPRAAVRAILLFAAGLVAVAGPLALRRTLAAAQGDAASLWGIHFHIGTLVDGDGGYTPVPGVADDIFGHVDDAREVAEASLGRSLAPGEVSRYWFRLGVDGIAREPWGYVRLVGRKLRRMVAPGEHNDFGDEYVEYARLSPALRTGIGFGTLLPLATLGLVIAARQHPSLLWCGALAAAYSASLLLFFVTARYRLPIVPPLLLLAGAALTWLADTLARATTRPAARRPAAPR